MNAPKYAIGAAALVLAGNEFYMRGFENLANIDSEFVGKDRTNREAALNVLKGNLERTEKGIINSYSERLDNRKDTLRSIGGSVLEKTENNVPTSFQQARDVLDPF